MDGLGQELLESQRYKMTYEKWPLALGSYQLFVSGALFEGCIRSLLSKSHWTATGRG
jgi:hypothetical protein